MAAIAGRFGHSWGSGISGSSHFAYDLAVLFVAGSVLFAGQPFFAGEQAGPPKPAVEVAGNEVDISPSAAQSPVEVDGAELDEVGAVRQGKEPSSRHGRDGAYDLAAPLPSAGTGDDTAPVQPVAAASATAMLPTPEPQPVLPVVVAPAEPTPAALQVVRYRVSKGDTLTAIAAKYGVSKDTIIAASKLEKSANRLTVGQELVFPPVDGALYRAVATDTPASIAARYSLDVATIVSANGLDPERTVVSGQLVIVPAVKLSAAGKQASAPAASASPSAAVTVAASSKDGDDNSHKRRPLTVAQVSLAIDPNVKHWAVIQSMIEPAQESQRDTGVPASATIAQAIHESAWGESGLSRNGYNYFGIKAQSKDGTKGSISMNTSENIRGKDVTVKDAFRAYSNMTESFEDHGRFFEENPRYAKAMANVDDPRAFVRLISEAGYATDPNYARKVIAYMDKYNLYLYDLPPDRD